MKASEIPHPTEEQKAEYDRFIKAKADQPHVYENSPFLAYHYTNADVLEPIFVAGQAIETVRRHPSLRGAVLA